MLRTVGEAPVDSLQSGLLQAETAEAILDEVSSQVQAGDWDFNREEGIMFHPTTDGEIVIPDSAYRIDACNRGLKVVQRGNRLYDKTNHTFKFTTPIQFDVVWFLAFEDLPEAARQYVYLRAARKFQMLTLGSADLEGFTKEDEQKALIQLQNFDSDVADYNLFDSDPESAYIVNRD